MFRCFLGPRHQAAMTMPEDIAPWAAEPCNAAEEDIETSGKAGAKSHRPSRATSLQMEALREPYRPGIQVEATPPFGPFVDSPLLSFP